MTTETQTDSSTRVVPKITPCLWFDNNAEEAIHFYTSIFKNSKIHHITHLGEMGPDSGVQVITAHFSLDGQEYMALQAGPMYQFTEGISMFVSCDSQEEVDYFWNKLTADGGEESMCGWLKDKFGLSWQIVPKQMGDLMSSGTAEQSGRVTQAMFQMRKLDISVLQQAYDGA